MTENLRQVAFNTCAFVFEEIREVFGHVRVFKLEDKSRNFLWMPDVRPRVETFYIDFLSACNVASLEEQARIFLTLRFLQLWDEVRVKKEMGLTQEIYTALLFRVQDKVGEELLRRKLFPVNKYFNMREKP